MNDSNHNQIQSAVLAAILENAVDAIINITANGIIDSINPAAEDMFGYAAEDLLGQNVKILMPQPDRDQHDQYIKNYINTGTRKIIGIGREVIGRRKDGSTFPMHLAVSEIKVADRHLFTGIVRDISDLKRAERELEEANEKLEQRVIERTSELRKAQSELVRNEKFATLGKVSGGIAHEIRNPLNAVKTSAYYLLNAREPTPEKTREHLERIDRQVSLIDHVITALSDVAKLPDASLLPTNLAITLNSCIGSVRLPENIATKIELPDNLPEVMVDENQIVIAIKNLIRNARDAMVEGGSLIVKGEVETESVTFQICDTGTGIPEDILPKILEPLFTTKARGMGLGLSITRAIVEKNKGKLLVESELGVGSCFSFSLRRSDAQ